MPNRTQTKPIKKLRFGEYLIDKGIITEPELNFMLARQKKEVVAKHKQIGNIILYTNLMRESDLCKHMTEYYEAQGAPRAITAILSSPDTLEVANIMEDIDIHETECVPFYIKHDTKEVMVGAITTDKLKLNSAQTMVKSKYPTYALKFYRIIEYSFLRKIERLSKAKGIDTKLETMDLTNDEKLQILYNDAVKYDASDLHMEPYENYVHVRLRVSGILEEYTRVKFNNEEYKRACRIIRMQAKLPTDGDDVMLDGSIKDMIGDGMWDGRVNIQNCIHGLKVTIRFQTRAVAAVPLDGLGYSDTQFSIIQDLMTKPNGLILLEAPMGNGKTTTIYSMLNALNDGSKVITTIENPVEVPTAGIIQVEIDDHNTTFDRVARGMMRQDVNVCLVGEIRDGETLDVAIKLGETGMLVFSTMHTRDVFGTFSRVRTFGGNLLEFVSTFEGAISQRLVRRLCPKCLQDFPVSSVTDPIEKLFLTNHKYNGKVFRPRPGGCAHCGGTGYKGRMVVSEILRRTKEVEEIIYRNVDSVLDIENKLKESDSVTKIAEDALTKMSNGETSLDELIRMGVLV